jgi:hypothetical protein
VCAGYLKSALAELDRPAGAGDVMVPVVVLRAKHSDKPTVLP